MELIQDPTKLSLYFDIYRYKLKMKIPGVHYFRSVKSIDQYNQRLNQIHTFGLKLNIYTISQFFKDHSNYKLEPIYDFILFKINQPKNQNKVIVSYDSVNVYSNDVNELINIATVNKFADCQLITITELKDYDKNNIYKKKPKHKYRIYLNYSKITDGDIQLFMKLLMTNDCAPSRTLSREMSNYNKRTWVNETALLLWASHFIDINDEIFITMFSLTFPKTIRKIVKIIQR